MRLLFKGELFDAQLLRTVGHAPYGGADISECIVAARSIPELDLERWAIEWTALAERILASAEESAANGHKVSARGAWLRASNYFRNAYVFRMQAPTDARLVEAHRLQTDAFRKAVAT